MKTRSAVLIMFALSLVACGIEPVKRVSSSELLANPKALEGQRVRIEGIVSYGFENCVIDGEIWYWPKNASCYDTNSSLNAWQGHGVIIGTVSLSNHGHLGMFPFTIINATIEHW